MKNRSPQTNGSGTIKSQAERILLAKHGNLEKYSRTDVKKLIHELHMHQIQLAWQNQRLLHLHNGILEARGRYHELCEFVPLGYLTLDPQGIIKEINLAGAGMLRTEKNRLLNQPFHLWIAPEHKKAWQRHVQKVFSSGTPQSCEVKLLPHGEPPLHVIMDSQLAPGASPRSCLTAIRDISAHKQAQNDLHVKEQLLNGASDSIFLHDLEGNFIYVNDAAWRDRGYDKEELLRENVLSLATPEYAGKRAKLLDDLRLHGELIFESAHRRKDGSALPVEIHARLIELEDRQLILSVARDITKRQRAERALQQEQARAQQYFDIARVMMLVLDNAGRIIRINKKGCEILGYQEEELIGRDWFNMCLSPGDSGQLHTVFDQLLSGRLEGAEYHENPVRTKDGRERLIAFHNAIFREESGQISGILCSGEDVTERRQAEAALRQSERELSFRNRIAQIFLTVLDDAVYDLVLAVVLEALQSKCGLFGYLDDNGALVVPSMSRDNSTQRAPSPKDQREMGQGASGSESAHGCPFLLSSLPLPGCNTIERCLTIPLRCVDKIIGILTVANKETDYDDQDVRLLNTIADIIAPILHDRLQKNLQEKDRQWAEEALRLAAHKWRTTFDSIGEAVCLLDPEGRILQCNQAMLRMTGKSFDTILERPCWEVLQNSSNPRDDCPFLRMKQTLKREEAIFSLEDRWVKESVDPILDEMGALIGGVHLASDITVAKKAEADLRESEARFRTIFDQAAVGVALIESSSGRFLKINQKFCDIVGLTEEDITATTYMALTHPDDLQSSQEYMDRLRQGLVRSFSIEQRYRHRDGSSVWVNLTVSAVQELDEASKYHIAVVEDITQRQQAEIEVRQGLDKLQHALTGTVGALASTVETKDPYTAGHQQRVAQLACAMAKEMGLSTEIVEGIQVLSFLHDIGKIAVPAEILSRPGKISAIEFNLIKSHPEVGYNILKDIEFPWPVAQAVLQHHERLDGSGYPGGLTDAEIILEARILAVADVVEAMASHRPYRPSLGTDAALAEIAKHKGSLFDAAAVDACLRLFREKDFTFQ